MNDDIDLMIFFVKAFIALTLFLFFIAWMIGNSNKAMAQIIKIDEEVSTQKLVEQLPQRMRGQQ